LRARTTVPKNVAPIHLDRLKMLCWRLPSKEAAAQPPAPSAEERLQRNSPKGECPRPWAMAGYHPAKASCKSASAPASSHHIGLPSGCRLGSSKQVMVEIGRFRPRPSPCLDKGRCSLRWSYPDTRMRVAPSQPIIAVALSPRGTVQVRVFASQSRHIRGFFAL